MKHACVSIIVPVYQVEQYLKNCVDSILNQSYSNLEIILVDDGSPDHSGHICDEYAKKDERVKVIHKENGGLSDARNAGIEIATGEYLMFVDSDDFLSSGAIQTLVEVLEEQNADMAVGSIQCVDEQGNSLHKSWFLEDRIWNKPDYFFGVLSWMPMAVAKLYKREIFLCLRFPVGKLHEDEFTAHHIAGICEKIVTSSYCCYYYLQRSGSITNQYHIGRLDAAEALLDRIQYVTEHCMENCVAALCYAVVNLLQTATEQLDLRQISNRERFEQLYHKFRKIYFKKARSKLSLRYKVRVSLFCCSYRAYGLFKKIR